jgi:diadenosine tetraphosphate (Ap4A) HIT family hydrolase
MSRDMPKTDCLLCRGAEADAELERVQVWEDKHWRLAVSLSSEVAGFAYLEPKRHIPYIHTLDGEEAATFGPVLAKCCDALRAATGAEVIYTYIFGDGVAHLHVHLAPHRAGDALSDQMIRGEIVEEKLPSGITRFYSEEFPALPRAILAETAEAVRQKLNEG